MDKPLTEDEQNLLKDLLKELDHHSVAVRRVAESMKISPSAVDSRLNVIWRKLQNGRVTFVQDEQ